jgi:hypothetical protein
MSWTGVLGAVALGLAERAWAAIKAPRRSAPAPIDATAERQGTAAGAAANYSAKVTERNAHASLEARLDSKLREKR